MMEAQDIRTALDRLERDLIVPKTYTPDTLVEIANVIEQYANDSAHLERATTHLAKTCKWVPVPSQWRKALSETRDTTHPHNPTDVGATGCERCNWTGFVMVERGGYSAVDKCGCRHSGTATTRPAIPADADPEQVRRVQQRLRGIDLSVHRPANTQPSHPTVAAPAHEPDRLFEVIAGAKAMQVRAQRRRDQIAENALADGRSHHLGAAGTCAQK